MDERQTAQPSFIDRLRRGRKRGIALFEVIIALGILGIIITGAVLLLQGAQERIARNETLQLINQVRAEANRIWASQSTYDGLAIHLLAQSGGLPDYVWRDTNNNNVYNVSGTDAYLSTYEKVVSVWGDDSLKRMTIGLADLDPGPCLDILSSWADKTRAVAGVVRASVVNAVAAGIGDKAAAWWTATADVSAAPNIEFAAPFTAAEAATMCVGPEAANDLYIMFQG